MEAVLGTNNTVGLLYFPPVGIGTEPFLCFEIHGCVCVCILNRPRPPLSLLRLSRCGQNKPEILTPSSKVEFS